MNDLVLEGFVKNFAEARGLSHLKQDELFEAFATSSILRKYHQADIPDLEDSVLVGGSGDGGLDAVAILVNGRPARTEEDVQFFVENLRRLDVEFVFVQAKSSPNFNAADIGSFIFGIEQFFTAVGGSDPKVAFNSDIGQLIDLTRHVYDQTIKMQDNPKCFFYYASSGKWTDAPDPSGRLADGEDRLRKLNIFIRCSRDAHRRRIT